MRKSLNILLVLMITFFAIPFGGITTLADAEDSSTVSSDEAYEIDYVIKHEDGSKESVANGFFEKPALLLKKDDSKFVQITINNGDMIKELSNEYGDVLLVRENDDGSIVVQLRVNDDLSDMLLNMHVVVPGQYNESHTAILAFFKDSMKETNAEKYKLITSEGKNGPAAEKSEESETPEEPGMPDDPEKPDEDKSGDTEGNEESENGTEDESKEDQENESDQPFVDLDNGSYEIKVSYLRSDNDTPSAMARYMDEKAFVTIRDDEVEVTITVNNHETVTKLLVEGDKSTVAKLDGDKRYETFKLNRLEPTLNAYVEYQAPFGDSVYYGNADFRIVIDDEEIVETVAENQPGYHIENTILQLDDGYYTIDTSYIKEDGSDSIMGSYLNDSIFLAVQDGKIELTVTINEDKTVKKLQIDGKDPVESVVEGNNRYETFVLDDLMSLMDAYVEYQAPFEGSIFEGNADFRISVDEASIKQAKSSDKPGANIEESKDPEDPTEEPKNPEPKPTPEEPTKDPKPEQKPTPTESKEEDLLKPDKVIEIDYVIKHEDGEKESVANDFFKKPALLLEKDGKKYIQLTITNGDMIKELRNKYGDALFVRENDDGSIVLQLRVNDDLSDMLLEMHIIVPPMPGFPGYDEDHKAILSFDKESMKEVKAADNYMLVGTKNSKNGNGPFIKDNETPEKPEFGNGNNGKDEKDETDKTIPIENENPQTGDTTSILMYSMLFIGSLIPLAIKLRRRFV